MNFKYSFIFLFFIQLAIRYSNAKVTVDTICKNGKLIQMSNHFECLCSTGYALKNESTCEPIVVCDKLENKDKVCREYATCVNQANAVPNVLRCECLNGYISPQGICKPIKCNNYDCAAGKCIIDGVNPVCSCDIGKILQNGKCTGTGQTKCSLKCKTQEECKLNGKHYECVAKTQAPGTGGGAGTTTPPANGSFMNGMSIFSIIALFVMYIAVI
ncbi:28 kDa ookinete surface protein, putative [Plasmodium vinckei brucechwatti]|uniref:28 kDa ookinete surface protein, putative n=1 Tax=Plasmodium vinckei brucechwatti TaxID=119398 RepID=A0A6V7RX48_PLAVN|nr:28 kDa ookinete surface protein, putative [Plasmodium vinckei brucechwatti]